MAVETAGGEVIWEGDLDLPDVSSPVASEGRLYVGSSGGVLTCYDAATGKEVWLEELEEWLRPLEAIGPRGAGRGDHDGSTDVG